MIKVLTGEIFCLGNELLIGRTVNKNASEIALALTKIGVQVNRETTVRDNFNDASMTLKEILSRDPSIVVITGGLGPTHDDIQLSVVSDAIGQKLEYSEEAIKMLETRYGKPRTEIKENQLKMAKLPQNAIPLQNTEGSAPGSKILFNKTLIFCLPGVPREMRALLSEHVIPLIHTHFKSTKKTYEFGFSVYNVGESILVDLTNDIRRKYSTVGFKTHPKKDNDVYWVQLHVYTIDETDKIVKDAVEEWYNRIKSEFNPKMTEIAPIFDDNFLSEE